MELVGDTTNLLVGYGAASFWLRSARWLLVKCGILPPRTNTGPTDERTGYA